MTTMMNTAMTKPLSMKELAAVNAGTETYRWYRGMKMQRRTKPAYVNKPTRQYTIPIDEEMYKEYMGPDWRYEFDMDED